jgi:hypothetical protein
MSTVQYTTALSPLDPPSGGLTTATHGMGFPGWQPGQNTLTTAGNATNPYLTASLVWNCPSGFELIGFGDSRFAVSAGLYPQGTWSVATTTGTISSSVSAPAVWINLGSISGPVTTTITAVGTLAGATQWTEVLTVHVPGPLVIPAGLAAADTITFTTSGSIEYQITEAVIQS